jgi:hypothetical protein
MPSSRETIADFFRRAAGEVAGLTGEDDLLALQEAESFENPPDELEKKHRKERLKSDKQDRKARKKYANKLHRLVVYWLFGIALLISAQGIRYFPGDVEFRLSENVVVAMIGGTTLNVLGLYLIVVRYLFSRRPNG